MMRADVRAIATIAAASRTCARQAEQPRASADHQTHNFLLDLKGLDRPRLTPRGPRTGVDGAENYARRSAKINLSKRPQNERDEISIPSRSPQNRAEHPAVQRYRGLIPK
jgi:hypothetical protein